MGTTLGEPSKRTAVGKLATLKEPSPPEWRVRGYRVAVEYKPDQGVYVAQAADLPGVYGRGETRTEALRALEGALGRAGGLRERHS